MSFIISHWRTELKRKKEGKKLRLLVTILKCFWQRILLQGVLHFTEVSCQLPHQKAISKSHPVAKAQKLVMRYHAFEYYHNKNFIFSIQTSSLVAQSVLLGSLADYFTIKEPTAEDTRNAYLYALGKIHRVSNQYLIGHSSRCLGRGVVITKPQLGLASTYIRTRCVPTHIYYWALFSRYYAFYYSRAK